jgi:hypothetical protein
MAAGSILNKTVESTMKTPRNGKPRWDIGG